MHLWLNAAAVNRTGAAHRSRAALLLALLLARVTLLPAGTFAQNLPTKSAPHDGYWACFQPFLDGDFRTAGRSFREAAKDGVVNLSPTTQGPWIDAICYH